MSGLLISGFVVGGFGLLVLIIGAILMATAKACTAADEACNSSKNRKKAGIGMVVMGCVLGVVGGVLLFLAYRNSGSSDKSDYNLEHQVALEAVGSELESLDECNTKCGKDFTCRFECSKKHLAKTPQS